ncbi:MAG TPA: hypothetical protein VKV21_17440 [Solirubrobacteraceae bacterium]|nr:hypothetical protein [Solirubrobacteraceae bacterium]
MSDLPGAVRLPSGGALADVLADAVHTRDVEHAEMPPDWAASGDDVEVARALIDGGFDVQAPGASIALGSPLDDAVGCGCRQVARLVVLRGARVEKLGHVAALGMLELGEDVIGTGREPLVRWLGEQGAKRATKVSA